MIREIIVLQEAAKDLEVGKLFYERQTEGIGQYFVDSIISDIESLRLFHGIHSLHLRLNLPA